MCDDKSLVLLKRLPRSWLVARTLPSWGVGCIACAHAQTSTPFASFSVCTIAIMSMSNFKKHHASKVHRQATAAFLSQRGYTIGPSFGRIVVGAPPVDNFHKLWTLLDDGLAPANGIENVGANHKSVRMAWCLCEAMRRDDADFLSI